MEHATRSQFDYSIATEPPTSRQRQLAFVVIIVTLMVVGGMIPFSDIPLPRLDSFIPTIVAITFVADLVTSVLLFGQFAATGSRALLMLASGYLFSSLIVIPHALTFPGAFEPLGLTGSQSAAWLSILWRLGLAVSLAGYAWLLSETPTKPVNEPPRRVAIYRRIASVFVLVCVLTLAATAGEGFMPRLFVDGKVSLLGHSLNGLTALTSILALVLLWRRGKSILDMWLRVAAFALICEGAVVAFFITSRFSLGFYSIRIISLLLSKVVLIALLTETMKLYAKLLAANRILRSERANKLASAEAAVAAVAHEIKQPLSSMVAQADAGRALLARQSPDTSSAIEILIRIKGEAFQVNEVCKSLRSMFRENDQRLDMVDVNSLVLETIQLLHNELAQHRIAVDTKLTPDLPFVSGSHEQLREVFLNLIENAIEAMTTTEKRPRAISVSSKRLDSSSIAILLEDTGPGIEPERLPTIFDAFVTTKAKGTGLGLGICKMIVDRHGGRLSASSGVKGGARFEIALPTKFESSPGVA